MNRLSNRYAGTKSDVT